MLVDLIEAHKTFITINCKRCWKYGIRGTGGSQLSN